MTDWLKNVAFRVKAALGQLIQDYRVSSGQRGVGKRGGESAALARLRGDRQLAAVAQQDVLDDRQAEARALRLARTALVDAVETLGQARDVFGVDADAAVGYRKR